MACRFGIFPRRLVWALLVFCFGGTEAFSQLQVAPSAWPDRPVLRVHYDAGWGHFISIRGDASPLSWSQGVSAQWTPGNVWVWKGPRGMAGFSWKPLIDDLDWSTGGNYFLPGGTGVLNVYPFFGASQGSLHLVHNFWSPQLNNKRTLRIFLPASYFENPAKHYPVLYMHDGQNLFDPNTAAFGVEWEVDETLNREVGIGQVREVIVVGIDNTSGRLFEYSPWPDPFFGGGGGDLYLDFLEDTVKPYVDSTYRTLPLAKDTLSLGSSMGGLISFHAGWTRSGTFGAVACMSSSFWWDGGAYIHEVESFTGNRPPCIFYVDSGDDLLAESLAMRDALSSAGYQFGVDLHHWYEPGAGHNEAAWADRLHVPLRLLLPWP
ncbi:MAG: alpha/beta hydrolase [Planctomycetota bacterium]|nr:MAG: alpha/beta hydrolase [Planctomycetota bacterium]